ncbi:MAG: hypothetical protein ACJ746_15910 [Bryobacteraceae bacterium]
MKSGNRVPKALRSTEQLAQPHLDRRFLRPQHAIPHFRDAVPRVHLGAAGTRVDEPDVLYPKLRKSSIFD